MKRVARKTVKPETIRAHGAVYVRSDLIGVASIKQRDNTGQLRTRVVGPDYWRETTGDKAP